MTPARRGSAARLAAMAALATVARPAYATGPDSADAEPAAGDLAPTLVWAVELFDRASFALRFSPGDVTLLETRIRHDPPAGRP